MIKALSLAAALVLLPLSASVAQETRGPSEDAIEAAAEAFEARMEAFGQRAEAIAEDGSLSEDQRELRIAALWSEYQPDVMAFTATVTRHAGGVAAEALAGIDIEALVADALAGVDAGALVAEAMAGIDIAALTAEAMASPEVAGALAGAQGMAVNGSWASGDPEHMATYGLVADYALGEVLDAADEVETAVEAGSDEG
jgi:enamine deaminase RidA (YjgF/YER057c/UK114 family)